MSIQTINPATGAALKTYATLTPSALAALLESANQAYLQWRDTPLHKRSQCMQRLADLLLTNQQQYAELITTEMGKPITASRGEVAKCAKTCSYFAEHAEEFLQPRLIATEMQKSYVSYQPLGMLFAIMPWNFPFWQVFRCAAPNIMAGNTLVLKHAPIVTGSALTIEQLFLDAGFPPGIFISLIIDEAQAKDVIAHPNIKGVTLTGSVRAGRAVAEQAGKYGKKTVLELGGSDPYIILPDADLELAAKECVKSRLGNSGQVCIAAKRLIVVASVKEKFQQQVMAELKHFVMGDPEQEHITLGPLARRDLREQLQKQVDASVAKGATLLCGGKIPPGAGFYYPITVLDQVKKGMPAYEEELFGPVIAFMTAKDEAEAIAIANDSIYGLSAAIFTQDIARGEQIATRHLDVGCCYINQMVSTDPRLPFGGVKASGIGRELAAEGMHEFMNIKTVGIR